MGESEVRHANAYAELLNRLGLNDDFSEVANVPAIKARQKYMDNAMSGNTGSNKDYMESVLLFSLFIENVSLFSQFLVLMVMNQDKGYLKGISNAISSTALEENLHAKLGADIIKTIRIEQPSWFTPELDARVNSLVAQSFEAEKDILNWIFELGDISSISKLEVTEYVKNRYNLGLQDAGFSTYFSVDTTLLEKTEFFDLQVNTTTHVDFFNKRSSNYTKKASSFDADSLF
jgi:ribonucleoside-diphosphate reductase beta chain